MKSVGRWLLIFFAVGIITWLVSFAVDGLRPIPERGQKLGWAPQIMQQQLDLDGTRVRYVKAGNGPDLVLFHTLRTQLDIYQKMFLDLSQHFTVYAVDYPGHGWSDIPDVEYTPQQFYLWSEKILEKLDVSNATIAGISIGGTIVLEIAARQNPRVSKAISINPFDYPETMTTGLTGSSLVAQVFFTATDYPFIGETFMRLRSPFVERIVFRGGVSSNEALSDEFAREMSRVGNRPGHMKAFLSLLRHENLWQQARKTYGKIKIPVLLIYGDEDWAIEADRQITKASIPNVKSITVQKGGHFLSLDRPQELLKLIKEF